MATRSEFDDPGRGDSGNGDESKATDTNLPDPDPDLAAGASVAGDSVTGNPSTATNPRKRKKSSRACDFCHVNHQPCDNAKPRCSYCERHNKSCLYLRPQKKRGPAQGYRSALHTLRESAAAWGAALNLIPSLGPVVEGYLKQPEGRRLVKAIKDPTQQEFFIQAWQQSGVFKTFFPDEASASDDPPKATPDATAPTPSIPHAPSPSVPTHHQPMASHSNALTPVSAAVISPPPLSASQLSHSSQSHGLTMPGYDFNNPFGFIPPPPPSSHDGRRSSSSRPGRSSSTARDKRRQASISLSDIMAKDAARSSLGFSQTLGSLGFAPNETLEDFLDMTFNPEPMEPPPVEQDPEVGTDQDQRAYYELLMGRRFA